MMNRARASIAGLAVAAGASVLVASPASSEAAAAHGRFDEYSSGPELGYTAIDGQAQLVRTADGRTIATVEVQGLLADRTYAVHVHDGRCAALGGHYFFDNPIPDGDGPNADELWPGPVTANRAGNARGSSVVGATAGPNAQSVVVHATPSGGPRIACADLS